MKEKSTLVESGEHKPPRCRQEREEHDGYNFLSSLNLDRIKFRSIPHECNYIVNV